MAFIVPALVAIGGAVTAGAATGTTAAVIGGTVTALGVAKGVQSIASNDNVQAPDQAGLSTSDISKRSQQLRFRALQRADNKFGRQDTILGGPGQQQTLGGGPGKSLLGE